MSSRPKTNFVFPATKEMFEWRKPLLWLFVTSGPQQSLCPGRCLGSSLSLCRPSRSGLALLFESLLQNQSTFDGNVNAEQTCSMGLRARGKKKRLEWEMIFFSDYCYKTCCLVLILALVFLNYSYKPKSPTWSGTETSRGGERIQSHFSQGFCCCFPDPGMLPRDVNDSGMDLLLLDILFCYLQRGEGREKVRERNINVRNTHRLPLPHTPTTGTRPTTQAHTLTGNRTSDPSLCGTMPNPLSYTGQGNSGTVLNKEIEQPCLPVF
ncbi:hypothetical protein HJG60_009578 [Phyllostomus discolor]|uniref:Uncharacterized protein n=1 Tax=Phyllostomus discolor TaxID=89673 RepID=A0A833YFE4_9CHIR|nr:hypothetical protein HJG60_009578 [Phyllostomus discolor]